jgi:hypothetical protein
MKKNRNEPVPDNLEDMSPQEIQEEIRKMKREDL